MQELKKEVRQKMSITLEDHARRINYKQKSLSPVNYGHLRQSNGFIITKDEAEIFNNASYAPFVEFGTKTKVKVPSGFEELAAQYKGKKIGNFEEFKEDIREWCKRKGIEKYWFVVMLKLLKVGMNPKPFFIQPYIEGKVKYLKDVKKIVNDIRW